MKGMKEMKEIIDKSVPIPASMLVHVDYLPCSIDELQKIIDKKRPKPYSAKDIWSKVYIDYNSTVCGVPAKKALALLEEFLAEKDKLRKFPK